eukprot:SAG22_NODE_111_length_19607_cov_12.696637_11_plen_69_part_00
MCFVCAHCRLYDLEILLNEGPPKKWADGQPCEWPAMPATAVILIAGFILRNQEAQYEMEIMSQVLANW